MGQDEGAAVRFQASAVGVSAGYVVELARPGKRLQIHVSADSAGSLKVAKDIADVCRAKGREGWRKADLLLLRDKLCRKFAEAASTSAKAGSPAADAPQTGTRLFRKTKQEEAPPELPSNGRAVRKLRIRMSEEAEAPAAPQPASSSTSSRPSSFWAYASKKDARKLSDTNDADPKVASPKKARKKSSGAVAAPDDSRPGDRVKDEAFRDLFGNVVLVRAPSKKALDSDLRPWRDMEPSDVEQLTGKELDHYEKLLRLSSKRGRPERLARLVQLAQRNTLPLQMGAVQDHVDPFSLSAFLALADQQRQAVGAAELKRLEKLAYLGDNEFFSVSERRDRLVELIREERSGAVGVRSIRSLASMLTATARRDTDAVAPEANFTVGQQVHRRDEGEDWAIGCVTSVDPLLVTVAKDPAARGHEWAEVRHVPAEAPGSPAATQGSSPTTQ